MDGISRAVDSRFAIMATTWMIRISTKPPLIMALCASATSIVFFQDSVSVNKELRMSRYVPPTEPEVVQISRRHTYKDSFGDDKPPLRYANVDFSDPPQNVIYQLATIKGKVVLRETEAGRRNMRATFSETDRHINSLDINYYTEKTGNLHPKGSVTLYGHEIDVLLDFIDTMKRAKMPGTGSLKVEPGALKNPHFVTDSELTQALHDKPELLREVLENPNLSEDMKAIGYWRNSLNKFKNFLSDSEYFEKIRLTTPKNSAERVWQDFFELNKWIFGYGLLYISTAGVSDNKLEQRLRGGSILGGGSIPDALMRTRGALSTLCLVEIKVHSTPLVTKEPRGGSYLISKELSDAVSQCQTAVSVAEEDIHKFFQPTDREGFPTTDPIFNFRPRALLVIGNLSEFKGDNGPSVDRFRTFEMYRRSLVTPEIITYDELYDRARSLVEDRV